MAQYIDKAALVAEINKRIMEAPIDCYGHQRVWAYNDVKDILDTLEVKEVDLVEELDYDDYITFFKKHPEYNNVDWGFEETWEFGQYCYKLGLKALKEK